MYKPGEEQSGPQPEIDDDPTDPSITPEDLVPLSIDPEKKRIIQSIVSVFETGTPEDDYSAVVVLKDGAGISYGKHQSTDHSDTLDAIVYRYADLGGRYSNDLKAFVPQLESDASASVDPDNLPTWVVQLMEVLREAGRNDVLMQRAQDQIFDELYWRPAADHALAMQLVHPLSWLVCYDSTIHSGSNGVTRIRKRFPEVPPSAGGDEEAWTKAYLQARRAWLAAYDSPTVQKTVYRIDAMLELVAADNWSLEVPIQISKPRATVT